MQATERLIPRAHLLGLALLAGACTPAAPVSDAGSAPSRSPEVSASAVLTAQPSSQPTPTGTGSPVPAARSVRIGLVADNGGRNDGSSNQLAESGLQNAAKEFGVMFEVAESEDETGYVRALTRFAESNYDLVIAVGIQTSTSVAAVARRFPSTRFALLDSFLVEGSPPRLVELPNVTSLLMSDQFSGYALGVAAVEALKRKFGNSETGTVCTLGIQGRFLPSELAIAGFQDAVRTRAPKVQILAAWDDFNAPGTAEQKGMDVGVRHGNQSCDVFFAFAGNAGIGYMKAAAAAGRISVVMYPLNYIFHDNFVLPERRMENAPAGVLAMGIRPLNAAVRAVAQDAVSGTLRPGLRPFAATDALSWGPAASTLTTEAKAAVSSAITELIQGRIQPKTEVIVR
jgi:basic membrane lipoprotein Med (substrate-binding protein (PBP1-ABC) superfamily)